jgi:aquaporin NIP
MIKKSISELLGTFALVFCGTGAIVIDEETGGGVSHIGVAITFGLIVMWARPCLPARPCSPSYWNPS